MSYALPHLAGNRRGPPTGSRATGRMRPVVYLALLLLALPFTVATLSSLAQAGERPPQTGATDAGRDNPATDTPAVSDMAASETAYRAGDFEIARNILARLAETGDALAQYRLAHMAIEGKGGDRDAAFAAGWLEKSAEQGNTDAQAMLGHFYLQGAGGVEPDAATAAHWLTRAAEKGNANAQYQLGLLYRRGAGVPADPVAALTWMRAAALQGRAQAQFQLGVIYAGGIGVTRDMAEAIRWTASAAEAGYAPAQFSLARSLSEGVDIEKDEAKARELFAAAAKAGLMEAQTMVGSLALQDETGNKAVALDWFTKAAAQGDAAAQSNLGYMYATGTGVDADDTTAAGWYRNAAQSGLPRAQAALALFYEKGRGVEADQTEALRWYQTAAQSGLPAAQIRLGQLQAAGQTDIADAQQAAQWVAMAAGAGDKAALQWLETAARNNQPIAQGRLAHLLDDSGAVPTDPGRALELYRSAADAGDPFSQLQLGLRYAAGAGVEQDYVEAHKWVNLSAADGNAEAIKSRALFAKLMTPEQVSAAQRAARDWTTNHLEAAQ